MHIEVPRVPPKILGEREAEQQQGSGEIRRRVEHARRVQLQRNGCVNSALSGRNLEQVCALKAKSKGLIQRAMDQLGLSARAYHRILRLARTIADLDGAADIQATHLSEAIGYRRLDRKFQYKG